MIETNNVTLEKELRVITEREDAVHIKRRLGFCSGVALIVDGIIGSGIFVSPKGILANTGSVGLSLVIWCVCGFISILAALVFAELGALVPKSGGDLGSGIFVSPKEILANTGSVGLSLVIWCVCGFISILAALVFAELGALVPKSGGDLSYLLAVFGRFPAFMYMWSQLITGPSGQIILGLTVAEYMSKAISDKCGPSFLFKQIVAATVISE
ncbi:SLC7A9 [Mytilus coruscus]|uniref:SLC7A9 n=1 Tax=Mytilus coruscus TaxID=42192 RepID=A0A6J8DDF5_MYTCO|nr:SLC7A9 [Mytilus coruscus]